MFCFDHSPNCFASRSKMKTSLLDVVITNTLLFFGGKPAAVMEASFILEMNQCCLPNEIEILIVRTRCLSLD